jgi:hypothetical protein
VTGVPHFLRALWRDLAIIGNAYHISYLLRIGLQFLEDSRL